MVFKVIKFKIITDDKEEDEIFLLSNLHITQKLVNFCVLF